MKPSLSLAAAIASAAALTVPQAAGATTYCVAKPSCVAAGGTGIPSFGLALDAAAIVSPGPDRVEIGPGDFVSPSGFSYFTQAGNGVDVVGSGRGITRLVTSAGGQGEATLKMIGAHESSVSDLSIVAPSTGGQLTPVWALDTSQTARRVDIGGTNSFVGVGLHNGGSILDSTIEGSGTQPALSCTGACSIATTSIKSPGVGFAGDGHANITRSRIEASKGAIVSGAGKLTIDNSLIVTHGGSGLATDFGGDTSLSATNVTIVGDGNSIGIAAGKGGVGHSTHVAVENSIVSNYAESIHVNQDGGATDVKVTNSSYDPASVVASAGQLDATGNLSGDPHFTDATGGDFHLSAASSLIDGGSADGVADADLDGAKRALDGNGDGSAIPDIGAYESPAVQVKQADPGPPAPPPITPPPTTPDPAPVIRSLSYAHSKFRVVLSKNARVQITVRRRTGRPLGSLSRAVRIGKSTIAFKGRIGRRSLKRGRYVAVAVATDKLGHRSKKRSIQFRW